MRFFKIGLFIVITTGLNPGTLRADAPKQPTQPVSTSPTRSGTTSSNKPSSSSTASSLTLDPKGTQLSTDTETIVDTYPVLQKFISTEKKSNTYIGFGVSPITILNSKLAFSVNLFQVHWIRDPYDIELFSFSYGVSFGQNQSANSNYFVFRTAPKFKLFGNITIGPLLGLEFVSFPGLNAQLNKNNLFTPSETFSSSGLIFGASISETFHVGKSYLVKVNQIGYQEKYSYIGTKNGWTYYFPNNSSINADPTPIKASFVIVLEISVLY